MDSFTCIYNNNVNQNGFSIINKFLFSFHVAYHCHVRSNCNDNNFFELE